MRTGSLVSLFFAVALSAGASAEVVNRIVATVDGEPITLFELEQFLANTRPASGAVDERQALQALVVDRLVAKEIAAKKIQVRDVDVDKYIERIRGANKLSEKDLENALAQEGLTLEKYRAQVKKEIEKVQLLNREIHGRVNVTPEDVERHYEANKKEYLTTAKVHLRHIVLRLDPEAPAAVVEAVQERAKGLRERIVDGKEDFAELAKQYSEDTAASSGGDLGEIEPGQVLPEFDKALEKLDEGDVSEPIRTSAGVHILKVEKKVAEGYRPLDEVGPAIKEKLYGKALDERYRRWLEEDLQKRHYVEIKL